MSKRNRPSRRARRQAAASKKGFSSIITYTAIGGIILFGLLYLALRPTPVLALDAYCQENNSACLTLGSDTASVKIVEISDYGCGHCKDFNLTTGPQLEDLYVDSGQVQWFILPFALSTQTLPAAEAALCAAEQEQTTAFHHALFAQQDSSDAMSRDWLLRGASQAGLNVDSFASCLDSGRNAQIVQDNIKAAQAQGVNATPSFFINGIKLEGNQPFQAFRQQIDSLLDS